MTRSDQPEAGGSASGGFAQVSIRPATVGDAPALGRVHVAV